MGEVPTPGIGKGKRGIRIFALGECRKGRKTGLELVVVKACTLKKRVELSLGKRGHREGGVKSISLRLVGGAATRSLRESVIFLAEASGKIIM